MPPGESTAASHSSQLLTANAGNAVWLFQGVGMCRIVASRVPDSVGQKVFRSEISEGFARRAGVVRTQVVKSIQLRSDELTQREESMTTIKAIWPASVVTATNVLVASGFSIVRIIRPQYLVPAGYVPTQASLILAMYAAARTIPLALFTLGAIYKQAAHALVILGALAGTMQLLDAGIGLLEHHLGKSAGPLFIAVLQFFVVYLLHRSLRITLQTNPAP
jgi:hypothetical protein